MFEPSHRRRPFLHAAAGSRCCDVAPVVENFWIRRIPRDAENGEMYH